MASMRRLAVTVVGLLFLMVIAVPAYPAVTGGESARGKADPQGDVTFLGEVTDEQREAFDEAADTMGLIGVARRFGQKREVQASVLTYDGVEGNQAGRLLSTRIHLAGETKPVLSVSVFYDGTKPTFDLTASGEAVKCGGASFFEEDIEGKGSEVRIGFVIPGTCVPRETKRIKVKKIEAVYSLLFYGEQAPTPEGDAVGRTEDSVVLASTFAQ